MSESEDDYLEKQLKIVFVGECNTGKTCLVQRYCNDDFYRQYSPTSGIDFFLNRTVLHCRGDKGKNANNILNISLKIYDVGGKALDSNMLRQYIHGANIVVLVYDITNIKSFEALPAWLNCVNENANEALITLMGNKIIEKYTDNVRFCVICNYLSKIIPAVQSRCTRFRFAPLASEQIIPRLNYVIEKENLTVTEDGKEALLTLSGGDMRKVLNILQSTSMAYKEVNEINVYTCVGHPLKNDIANIIKWLLNEPEFDKAYTKIQELKIAKGLALEDILSEIHLYIHRIELPSRVLCQLLIKMSNIEQRLAQGGNENIQLSAVLSAFIVARDLVIPDNE